MKCGRWQWTFWRRFQRTSLFGGLEMTVARDPFPTRVGPKYHCFFGWLRVISEIWRRILLRFGFGPTSAEIFLSPQLQCLFFAEVLLVMQFEYGTSLFPAKLQDKDIFWQAHSRVHPWFSVTVRALSLTDFFSDMTFSSLLSSSEGLIQPLYQNTVINYNPIYTWDYLRLPLYPREKNHEILLNLQSALLSVQTVETLYNDFIKTQSADSKPRAFLSAIFDRRKAVLHFQTSKLF